MQQHCVKYKQACNPVIQNPEKSVEYFKSYSYETLLKFKKNDFLETLNPNILMHAGKYANKITILLNNYIFNKLS